MPPTVMTPWFTPCCGLDVVLVGGAADPLPLELGFAPVLLFPPEAVWTAGAALLFVACVAGVGVLLLLDAAGVAVAPLLLLGAAVPELLLPGEDVVVLKIRGPP